MYKHNNHWNKTNIWKQYQIPTEEHNINNSNTIETDSSRVQKIINKTLQAPIMALISVF